MENTLYLENNNEIFNYIKSLPSTYRMKSRMLYFKYSLTFKKVFNNGFDTAINQSQIAVFYKKQLKLKGKSSIFIPVPNNINYEPFDNVNGFLKIVSNFENDEISNRLQIAVGHQYMELLLFELYFPELKEVTISFHDFFKKTKFTKNNYIDIFNEINDKKHLVRNKLFFYNSYPTIRKIENNVK